MKTTAITATAITATAITATAITATAITATANTATATATQWGRYWELRASGQDGAADEILETLQPDGAFAL